MDYPGRFYNDIIIQKNILVECKSLYTGFFYYYQFFLSISTQAAYLFEAYINKMRRKNITII